MGGKDPFTCVDVGTCWIMEPPDLPSGLPMTSMAAFPLVFSSGESGMKAISLHGSNKLYLQGEREPKTKTMGVGSWGADKEPRDEDQSHASIMGATTINGQLSSHTQGWTTCSPFEEAQVCVCRKQRIRDVHTLYLDDLERMFCAAPMSTASMSGVVPSAAATGAQGLGARMSEKKAAPVARSTVGVIFAATPHL